jgi:hypothetical protein
MVRMSRSWQGGAAIAGALLALAAGSGAVASPSGPERMLAAFDGGDGLHP